MLRKVFFVLLLLILQVSASLCSCLEEKGISNVVIVGAGPIGLYAAFQFHASGYNVTIVEKRKEYIRNQILTLTYAYREFLNKVLPEIPKEILIPQSKAYQQEDNVFARINIKDLEKLLKHHLQILEKANPKTLKFVSEAEVTGIDFPTKESLYYSAIVESSTEPKIPFNYIVFAGGANDSMRNMFLGLPSAQTVPKIYGIVALSKTGALEKQTLQKNNKSLTIANEKTVLFGYREYPTSVVLRQFMRLAMVKTRKMQKDAKEQPIIGKFQGLAHKRWSEKSMMKQLDVQKREAASAKAREVWKLRHRKLFHPVVPDILKELFLMTCFPQMPVTPKCHILCQHVSEFMDKHRFWGLLSEQSIEALHCKVNGDERRLSCMRERMKTLKKILEDSFVRNILFDVKVFDL